MLYLADLLLGWADESRWPLIPRPLPPWQSTLGIMAEATLTDKGLLVGCLVAWLLGWSTGRESFQPLARSACAPIFCCSPQAVSPRHSMRP